MNQKLKWILYCFLTAFAFYWISNLLLWFPWSISESLGITLMLTVAPLLWVVAVYQCLIRYPDKQLFAASMLIGIIFLFVAAVLDYLFFGLIRNAMDDLYKMTTFYGYAFLLALPILEVSIIPKRIKMRYRKVQKQNFLFMLNIGLTALGILIIIIELNITL
ncbi:hypothetical protein [Salinivirga cyanobacteriivorans]